MATPTTVPNQRIVKIHRDAVKSDFLGIKNENWQYAARDLGAHALLLYLYFAANADGYNLALSPAAIRKAVGMPPQTYRDQFLKLIDKRYLVQTGGNTYDFYERPQPETRSQFSDTSDGYDFENDTFDVVARPQTVQNEPTEDREINIDTINNNINNGNEKQVSHSPQFYF